MQRNGMVSLVMAVGLVLGSTGAALATVEPNELWALDHARTAMDKALAIAHNVTGGAAVRIAFNEDGGRSVYRVRTLSKAGAAERVVINTATGQVVTVAAAKSPAFTSNTLADSSDSVPYRH